MQESEHVWTQPRSSAELPTLAVVVPCFNEEDAIPATAARLHAVLDNMIDSGQISRESFLYFVDDGSTDASWKLLMQLHVEHKNLCALKLSRNFGHQNALLAGLMSVRGRCDAAISIDADLQQDLHKIPVFVESYMAGAEIVCGVRNDRNTDTWLKKTSARGFYRFMKIVGVNIIPHHADFRLLGRRAIDALAEHTEPNIFLRATCLHLGFHITTIQFDVKERTAGSSKYSLSKMLKLAVDGITSFSIAPLRAISAIAMLIFGGCILMGFYAIVSVLLGDTVPGWASTTLPLYMLGGIQLFCLSIIGEYMAQVVTAVKRRPRYICEQELF
jgi:glycosyltransferase involved in cell wall biosynthesis